MNATTVEDSFDEDQIRKQLDDFLANFKEITRSIFKIEDAIYYLKATSEALGSYVIKQDQASNRFSNISDRHNNDIDGDVCNQVFHSFDNFRSNVAKTKLSIRDHFQRARESLDLISSSSLLLKEIQDNISRYHSIIADIDSHKMVISNYNETINSYEAIETYISAIEKEHQKRTRTNRSNSINKQSSINSYFNQDIPVDIVDDQNDYRDNINNNNNNHNNNHNRNTRSNKRINLSSDRNYIDDDYVYDDEIEKSEIENNDSDSKSSEDWLDVDHNIISKLKKKTKKTIGFERMQIENRRLSNDINNNVHNDIKHFKKNSNNKNPIHDLSSPISNQKQTNRSNDDRTLVCINIDDSDEDDKDNDDDDEDSIIVDNIKDNHIIPNRYNDQYSKQSDSYHNQLNHHRYNDNMDENYLNNNPPKHMESLDKRLAYQNDDSFTANSFDDSDDEIKEKINSIPISLLHNDINNNNNNNNNHHNHHHTNESPLYFDNPGNDSIIDDTIQNKDLTSSLIQESDHDRYQSSIERRNNNNHSIHQNQSSVDLNLNKRKYNTIGLNYHNTTSNTSSSSSNSNHYNNSDNNDSKNHYRHPIAISNEEEVEFDTCSDNNNEYNSCNKSQQNNQIADMIVTKNIRRMSNSSNSCSNNNNENIQLSSNNNHYHSKWNNTETIDLTDD